MGKFLIIIGLIGLYLYYKITQGYKRTGLWEVMKKWAFLWYAMWIIIIIWGIIIG